MSSSTPTTTADEEHLAMLRRLATLGMRLAEEIVERAVNSPYHPEADHEPGRAFASVSRAVRLTIALHAMLKAGSIAFRNGDGKVGTASGLRPAVARSQHDADDDKPDARDPARENLCDSESYDEARGRSLDDCVVAIHAGLGVDRSADVSTAANSMADETPALRDPARPSPGSPTPPAPSHKLGYWRQREWPEPPKPPGSG